MALWYYTNGGRLMNEEKVKEVVDEIKEFREKYLSDEEREELELKEKLKSLGYFERTKVEQELLEQ